MITRKERIAVIKECEKMIYDYRRYYLPISSGFKRGVIKTETLLFNKRKRLEAKLKK